jgi:HEAT repeat protein
MKLTCVGVALLLIPCLYAADPPGVADLIKVLEDPTAKVQDKREACSKLCRMETAAKDATGAVIKLAISDDPRLRAAGMETLGWIAEDLDRVTPILIQGFKDGERAIGSKATEAMYRLGLPALPYLKNALKDSNATIRIRALTALSLFDGESRDCKSTVLQALKDEEPEVGEAAIWTLAYMQPPDADMVDALKAIVANDKAPARNKLAAVRALGGYHRDAVAAAPALKKLLHDGTKDLRFQTALALASMAEAKDDIRPLLLEEMKGAERRVRAANALWQLGEKSDAITPALIVAVKEAKDQEDGSVPLRLLADMDGAAVSELTKLLADEKFVLRVDAVRALVRTGREGRDAVPSLMKLKDDKSPELQQAVLSALAQLAGPDKEIIKAYVDKLEHTSPAVRAQALFALAVCGAEVKDAVPAIASCLSDRDPTVRQTAATTLCYLGPSATAAVETLEKQLKEGLEQDQVMAAVALLRIQKDHPQAIEVLKVNLGTESSKRLFALGHLWDAGTARSAFLPIVFEAIRDPDPDIRRAAVGSLWGLEIDEVVLKALLPALKDPSSEVRMMTASVLGSTAKGDIPEVLPALENLLTDRSQLVRLAAAASVLRLDPTHKAAHTKLSQHPDWAIDNCRDAEEKMQRRPELNYMVVRDIQVCGLMGASAREAVPILKRIARRTFDPTVRSAAEEALNKITAEK